MTYSMRVWSWATMLDFFWVILSLLSANSPLCCSIFTVSLQLFASNPAIVPPAPDYLHSLAELSGYWRSSLGQYKPDPGLLGCHWDFYFGEFHGGSAPVMDRRNSFSPSPSLPESPASFSGVKRHSEIGAYQEIIPSHQQRHDLNFYSTRLKTPKCSFVHIFLQ